MHAALALIGKRPCIIDTVGGKCLGTCYIPSGALKNTMLASSLEDQEVFLKIHAVEIVADNLPTMFHHVQAYSDIPEGHTSPPLGPVRFYGSWEREQA